MTSGPFEFFHVRFELFVSDLEASIRFYETVLGFVATGARNGNDYVPLSNGNATIGLQQFAALAPEHHFRRIGNGVPMGVGVELVFEVDDVEAAYNRALETAEGLGGSTELINDRPWGRRDFRVIDPDGYYLRVST